MADLPSPDDSAVADVEVLPAQAGDTLFSSRDQAILDANRNLRIKIISDLAGKGTLPRENADKAALITLMKHVDDEVMTRAKIRVASKQNDEANDLNNMLVQALLTTKAGKKKNFTPKALEVPKDISFAQPVPGQTDVGMVNLRMKDVLNQT